MPAPNEITINQLLRLIETPECPMIADVSIDADFDTDPHLIPSAFRHRFDDLQGLENRLARHRCVVVCQKGLKLSQGMAAQLRCLGINAEYLQGGNHAWRANEEAPRVPFGALPLMSDGHTIWVTRHRPKIDRIACPWLLRRFVDRNARFLFVAPSQVVDVADKYGATPFDIKDTFWGHRGPNCTFDTMLDEFGLHTPALDRLARVIRAANTGQHNEAPEAAGLLALSVGLSRQCKDDLAQLEAGMAIYDALYRWARDGAEETHSWPDGHGI